MTLQEYAAANTEKIEAIKKAPGELTEEQQRRARAAGWKQYQDNIIKAGQLRGEISRGIAAGEDTAGLLLKALECISCMTGDQVFYTVTKRKLTGE